MSFRLTVFRLCLVGIFSVAFNAVSLKAQVPSAVPNSPVVFAQSAITTSLVDAPTVGSNQSGFTSDSQWLKVEFHYAVAPAPSKFLDAVEFRIWIEGRDLYAPEAPTKDGIPVALTGTVTYVSLPETRDAYGVFYVPPATLDRFATDRGKEDFDRLFNIHIEAYINGTKVDYFDKKKEQDGNWYQQLKPLTGYVYRQDQCVFIMTDPNHYPPIKAPATMIAQ